MSKIKFTKGELKRQRDSLKQFRHYLPTLQLKKQQLQMKILEARREMADLIDWLGQKELEIRRWAGLLTETTMDLKPWIIPEAILTTTMNIAGANMPIFHSVRFKEADYDYYTTPFWVDKAIEILREVSSFQARMEVIKRQLVVLEKELRVTTQRVNLFEKIKIPECLDNIRRIRISLGDQQANAVGISKVAKRKIEIREWEAVLA